MSTFSKGDRVRKTTVEHTVMGRGFTDHGEEFAEKGAVGTVGDVESPVIMWVEWDEGSPSRINVEHLEKVEPEWVVGQQVSGDDYERLPIGSSAKGYYTGTVVTKVAAAKWVTEFGNEADAWAPRALTHLPTATQPEDATDAYVEPEPLKDVWSRLVEQADTPSRYRFTDGDRVLFDGMATLKVEADGITFMPVKPAQCTSLYEHDGVLVRCTGTPVTRCEKHGAPFSPSVLTWTDAEAYGRVEVSS